MHSLPKYGILAFLFDAQYHIKNKLPLWIATSDCISAWGQSRLISEPAHDKTYNKTCATSKDSEEPVHPCTLIRVFADCMCLLQSPNYSKRDKRDSLPYWVDIHDDLSLCWSYRSYCRFCHALVHFTYFSTKTYIVVLMKPSQWGTSLMNPDIQFTWRNKNLFVLRFYGPVNPMGSCRARSVYLTTRLLGRLSPLSGSPVLCTFFRQKLTTALLESAEGREWP